MRIVDVIRTSEGGLFIVPFMQELSARGHDVTVILPDPRERLGLALADIGIPTVASATPMSSARDIVNPLGVRRMRRQILGLQPDVVFYQLIQTALVVRFALAGTDVITVHQVPGPLYLENPLIRRTERFLAHADDVIICGTDYTRDKYEALPFPAGRLHSIPFGAAIPEAPQPGERERLRAAWGIPQDAFTVVIFAYFYPPKKAAFQGRGIKGHEDLLRAWVPFSHENPRARLLLVGDGWGPTGDEYRMAVKEQFERAVQPGSVLWITGQTQSRDFYTMADVSVSPSLSEGHGAALAAGAMGLPLIVSDAGGLPETVEEGRSGWIFPAGDSHELLLRLRQACAAHADGRLPTMGAAARSIMLERFDAAKCAEQAADVIEAAGSV